MKRVATWSAWMAESLVILVGVTGCKGFFTSVNDTGSGTGTATGFGDYAYVVNASAGTISGFTVGTGILTALSGFPLALPSGFVPTTAVLTPKDGFLYLAGSGVVIGYSVGSTGALTQLLTSAGSATLQVANIVSMDVSPDGQWLIGLDSLATVPTVDSYQIGTSGLLTAKPVVQFTNFTGDATIVPNSIRVAPLGHYVAASLGTGGDVVFGFNTATDTFTSLTQVFTNTTSGGDQAVVFDSTESTLYIARSGTGEGVYPYAVSSTGLASSPVSGSPFLLGPSTSAYGPASILIDASGKYVYVGNKTNSSISAFLIETGAVLSSISGSPYMTGTTVDAIANDNSGKYLMTGNLNGSPDVDLFSFDTVILGKPNLATSALTGGTTEPAGVVAVVLTH